MIFRRRVGRAHGGRTPDAGPMRVLPQRRHPALLNRGQRGFCVAAANLRRQVSLAITATTLPRARAAHALAQRERGRAEMRTLPGSRGFPCPHRGFFDEDEGTTQRLSHVVMTTPFELTSQEA